MLEKNTENMEFTTSTLGPGCYSGSCVEPDERHGAILWLLLFFFFFFKSPSTSVV